MSLDLSIGKRIRFVHSDGELVGTINGEALLHKGYLYLPVYVREGDRIIVVHSSNILNNEEPSA